MTTLRNLLRDLRAPPTCMEAQRAPLALVNHWACKPAEGAQQFMGFDVERWEHQCERACELSRPAIQVMEQEAENHTREACTMALKEGGEQYRE